MRFSVSWYRVGAETDARGLLVEPVCLTSFWPLPLFTMRATVQKLGDTRHWYGRQYPAGECRPQPEAGDRRPGRGTAKKCEDQERNDT